MPTATTDPTPTAVDVPPPQTAPMPLFDILYGLQAGTHQPGSVLNGGEFTVTVLSADRFQVAFTSGNIETYTRRLQ